MACLPNEPVVFVYAVSDITWRSSAAAVANGFISPKGYLLGCRISLRKPFIRVGKKSASMNTIVGPRFDTPSPEATSLEGDELIASGLNDSSGDLF